MKVIKNINNNVALCLDSNNKEVVAFGKGIGFTKPPYEIEMKNIQHMYYDIEETYLQVISDLPEEIIELSTKIVDEARRNLTNEISSNIIFSLADHINFAIKRFKEDMNLKLPIVHDIQYLFEKEMEVGVKALAMIRKDLNVYLPDEEATYIALHIINAEKKDMNNKAEILNEEIIKTITQMIEVFFEIKIDKDGFNYSRFVSHMHYLIKRGKRNTLIQSDNYKLYEFLACSFPKTKKCAKQISKYLKDKMNCELTNEEVMYLILHINRLCAREDCNQ